MWNSKIGLTKNLKSKSNQCWKIKLSVKKNQTKKFSKVKKNNQKNKDKSLIGKKMINGEIAKTNNTIKIISDDININ